MHCHQSKLSCSPSHNKSSMLHPNLPSGIWSAIAIMSPIMTDKITHQPMPSLDILCASRKHKQYYSVREWQRIVQLSARVVLWRYNSKHSLRHSSIIRSHRNFTSSEHKYLKQLHFTFKHLRQLLLSSIWKYMREGPCGVTRSIQLGHQFANTINQSTSKSATSGQGKNKICTCT